MRIVVILCIILFFIMFVDLAQATGAYDKTFYEGNKTLIIQQSITGKTLFTIQQVSVSGGLTKFEEVFNITSYLTSDYTFKSSDISISWKQFKGNNNITNVDLFLFTPSNYSVVVDDYGTNSTWRSKEVYNNVTGLNDTIWYWDNQTVVIGNHTEIRDNSTWIKLNNLNGKVIKPKRSYTVKVVFTKSFEKEFAVKLTPTFVGVSEDRMTWWNDSYNTVILGSNYTGVTNFVHAINVTNMTGVSNTTHLFFNGTCAKVNCTDYHLIDNNATEEPHYVETNATSTGWGIWWINYTHNNSSKQFYGNNLNDNSYNNSALLQTVFPFGADFELEQTGIVPSGWTVKQGTNGTISQAYAHQGIHSVTITGTDILEHNVLINSNNEMSCWILGTTTGADTRCILWNGANLLVVVGFQDNGQFTWYDTGYHNGVSYVANTWYKFRIWNINYVAHTAIITITNESGGVLRNESITTTTQTQFDRVQFAGGSGSVTYGDLMLVYPFISPEPTRVVWGGVTLIVTPVADQSQSWWIS